MYQSLYSSLGKGLMKLKRTNDQPDYYSLLQNVPVIEEKKYKSFYLQLNQIVPVRFSKI